MSEKKGQLFVISGPSGVGKDSVIEEAKKLGLCFGQVITTTSRKLRGKEQEGKPYHFVTKDQFKKLIKEKKLSEWAKVYGHYYGNTQKEVDQSLKKNRVVILKVDPQGARAIKQLMPKAKVIFIVPPSFSALEKRLRLRKTDSEAVIKERLKTAKKEMEKLKEWDHVVVNEEDKIKKAAEKVKKIIESSTKKRYGRRILFGFFSVLILVGYFLVFAYFHPTTKKSAQNTFQNIITPLVIQKRIYQSQAILNFLPRSFSQAYLVESFQPEHLKTLDALFPIYKKMDWPVFQEILFFYQEDLQDSGVVFKLASPPEENWEKFQKAVSYIWAIEFPTQKPKTLSDGTETLELIPQEDTVSPKLMKYEGTDLKILSAQDSNLAFARLKDYAILAGSPETVKSAILAEKTPNQRVNFNESTRCIGENPYKLTFFSQNFEKDLLFEEDILFSLIFGQNKPKNDYCL